MIVVIADDFTGAAEIGGIGIRHGLRVVIQTRVDELKSADLLVIVAQTRSLNEVDACIKINQISEKLMTLEPDFIYKKIDSALRGHVLSEIKVQMQAFELDKALIVAGNPSLGRLIRDGQYTINDVPLAETGFSGDAHFPAKSSDVVEALDPKGEFGLVNLKPDDPQPQSGIVAADVSGIGDLNKWAKSPAKSVLYAGASGFFDALLSSMDIKVVSGRSAFPFGNRILFVGGTAFPKHEDFQKRLQDHGVHFSNMPEEIYRNKEFDPKLLEEWADDIVSTFENQNVYITMRHSGSDELGLSQRLCKNLGDLVWNVAARVEMDELLIEGGDTAATVLELLKIRKLKPVHEYLTGVIRMEVMGNRNFYVTTKPGSYKWTEDILIPRKASALK
ncbi:MAG: four-carbon acid sugar kinase family protein [Cyclobacteriaceae bacterium]